MWLNREELTRQVVNYSQISRSIIHVVDVGCGDGSFTIHLLSRINSNAVVVGCDLSQEMLLVAKSALPNNFEAVRCDASRLPIRPEWADLVLAKDVLHHAKAPVGVLVESRNIATGVGCKIVVIEANRRNPLMLLFAKYGDHNHITSEILMDAMRSSVGGNLRMTTVQAHPYYAYLKPSGSLMVALWNCMWLSFNGLVDIVPIAGKVAFRFLTLMSNVKVAPSRKSFNVVVAEAGGC